MYIQRIALLRHSCVWGQSLVNHQSLEVLKLIFDAVLDFSFNIYISPSIYLSRKYREWTAWWKFECSKVTTWSGMAPWQRPFTKRKIALFHAYVAHGKAVNFEIMTLFGRFGSICFPHNKSWDYVRRKAENTGHLMRLTSFSKRSDFDCLHQ